MHGAFMVDQCTQRRCMIVKCRIMDWLGIEFIFNEFISIKVLYQVSNDVTFSGQGSQMQHPGMTS